MLKPLEWKRVTEKCEIEDHLLRRNKRHLQQTALEECPPTQCYFSDILERFGTGPKAVELLKGHVTSDVSRFPPTIRAWLKQFRRTEEESQATLIDGMIFEDEYQTAFKEVNEKSSSSPSGLHYTIWKSIAQDDELASYMVIMMHLPFMYGFKNLRWCKCVDVMLEKKPGVRSVRKVHLIEADFDTALKLYFAKHMVRNSEQTQLTEEQWDGRLGRTATDAALCKVLAFEYG
mgnify:CR=1 FL=1